MPKLGRHDSAKGRATVELSPSAVELFPVSLPVEASRILKTTWQFARGGAGLLVTRSHGKKLPRRAAGAARDRFAHLGPTYVKLGQIIASSPGVFSAPVAKEFRTLLDQVPPADPRAIRELIIDQLGAPPEQVFASFDPVPIASASIAQVHNATLKSGERVVVKIQRPGLKPRMAADLQILRRVARALEWSSYGRMVNAREVVADFADNLSSELDFHAEGRAMQDWAEAMSVSEFADQVRAPKVYWEFTTGKILTMEFIDAVRIDDVAAVRAAGFDGTKLVRSLLLSLFESAFRAGVFHGDLHAGNVLVDPQGRVVLLDWGIVGRFDEKTRITVQQLLVNLMVNGNFQAAGVALHRLGAIGKPIDRHAGAADLAAFANPLGDTKLGDVSYAKLGKQLADLAKAYDAKLPRELVLVGKQLLYIERYIKMLAPRWRSMRDPRVVRYLAALARETRGERRASSSEPVDSDPA